MLWGCAYSYVEAHLPAGFKHLDNFSGNFSYEFAYKEDCLADLFEELGANAQAHGILDWGISQTTYVRGKPRAHAPAELN